jgi:hypothetical protein
LSAVGSTDAQGVFQDGFESGSLSTGWGPANGVAIVSGSGANGTSNFARLAAASSDLGASVANAVPGGAQEFYVDCYFRIQATTQRQFNLQVSDSTAALSDGAATINLRFQANGWAAYDGSVWQPITGLGSATTNQWYRARVGGQGWGTAAARWSAAISGAGATNFTSFATNLTWFQHGNPALNTAQSFVFTTAPGTRMRLRPAPRVTRFCSVVAANVPSDPYLMYGYDRRVLKLSHTNGAAVTFTVEVDFTADNTWNQYARFAVAPGQTLNYVFPDGYSAHWVRVTSDTATTATATFVYGAAAPQITGVALLPGGPLQLTFTGSAGQSYTVRASSDLTAPLANWLPLATGTFGTNAATFQEGNAAGGLRRFYTISMP